jgi:hypothetical protein
VAGYKWISRLHRLGVFLPGANADDFVNGADEDFAVDNFAS